MRALFPSHPQLHFYNRLMKCVLALDQGTTSSRSILFDHEGNVRAIAQKEFAQIYPRPGWVEHNALEIWQNTQDVIRGALARSGISGSVSAIIICSTGLSGGILSISKNRIGNERFTYLFSSFG